MLLDAKIIDQSFKVVPVNDIEPYVEEGWEFITEPSNPKAVLRNPPV